MHHRIPRLRFFSTWGIELAFQIRRNEKRLYYHSFIVVSYQQDHLVLRIWDGIERLEGDQRDCTLLLFNPTKRHDSYFQNALTSSKN